MNHEATAAAGLDYIERTEFEQRFKDLNIKVDRGFDGVSSAIERVSRKLEQREEQSRPRIGVVIAAIAGIGIPMLVAAFALVRNMTQLEGLRAWAEAHQDFSTMKTSELESALSKIREQQARNITRLDEQEMQHRWIADISNTEHDFEDRMARAYCMKCQAEGVASQIHFDPRRYSPLQQIGMSSPGDDD